MYHTLTDEQWDEYLSEPHPRYMKIDGRFLAYWQIQLDPAEYFDRKEQRQIRLELQEAAQHGQQGHTPAYYQMLAGIKRDFPLPSDEEPRQKLGPVLVTSNRPRW